MSTTDVQKLREMTGAGVMDCKKAIDDAKGDLDAAVRLINERGLLKAERKAGRGTGAGFLKSYLHNDRVGVLLELRCETDFVVRSEPFQELAHELAMHITAMNPADIDTLLSQPYVKDEAMSVEDFIKGVVAKVGENIQVARFCRYEI
ncbi:MAG: translation elongation factor Ts [bacterium]|nr:translation elongation factor Ts [bacterium]